MSFAHIFAVSGRARQLNHKLKSRKAAIISRREAEDHQRGLQSPEKPVMVSELLNGTRRASNSNNAAPQSPPSGFTAVNSKLSAPAEGAHVTLPKSPTSSGHPLLSRANTENLTVLNGSYIKGVSQEERMELIKSFLANPDLHNKDEGSPRRASIGTPMGTSAHNQQTRSESLGNNEGLTSGNPSNTSAVPIPSTPASLLPHLKPTQAERDDGGPYKASMVLRMESLHRGERILPPCDRCRRLHMDCLKNLTACMGCTKKHAKCSWKDVREEELRSLRTEMQSASASPEPALPPMDGVDSNTPSSHHSPLMPASYQPVSQEKPPRRELDLLPPTPSLPSPVAPPPTAVSPSKAVFPSIEKKLEQPSYPPLPALSSSLSTHPSNHSTAAASASGPTPSSSSSSSHTINQQLQDAANGLAAAHRSVFSPPLLPQGQTQVQGQAQAQPPPQSMHRPTNALGRRDNDREEEEDEGDRLQALAAQVYRSASAQQAQQQTQT